jgi:hypothetical protein
MCRSDAYNGSGFVTDSTNNPGDNAHSLKSFAPVLTDHGCNHVAYLREANLMTGAVFECKSNCPFGVEFLVTSPKTCFLLSIVLRWFHPRRGSFLGSET